MPTVVTGLLFVCLAVSAEALTHGSPWPMPEKITTTSDVLILNRNTFRFGVTGVTCDILEDALVRYFRIIFEQRVNLADLSKQSILRFLIQPKLARLDVKVENACEQFPSMGMDESCKLFLNVGNPESEAEGWN